MGHGETVARAEAELLREVQALEAEVAMLRAWRRDVLDAYYGDPPPGLSWEWALRTAIEAHTKRDVW